jgi:hypothetical protein
MKFKHAIVLLIIGYCFDFVGAFLKITHHPYADSVFLIATILKVAGGLILLLKLLTHPKLKEIFNS